MSQFDDDNPGGAVVTGETPSATENGAERSFAVAAPAIALPTGGGAIRGMGEMFRANPATGTASMSVPVAVSPGRGGFGPQLAVGYDSGAGNGVFGLGWSLGLPAITRKTDLGLPRYLDDLADSTDPAERDVYQLAGAEDLVPEIDAEGRSVSRPVDGHTVRRYHPRVEGAFARIERWRADATGDVHWRSISRDNVLTVYGADERSRIADPADARRVFSWLVCQVRDDRGQVAVYDYATENADGVDLDAAHERHRGDDRSRIRTANRYLKRVRYGNERPYLDAAGRRPRELSPVQADAAAWMFEVVLDYGEHDDAVPLPAAVPGREWTCRPDPFSSYRAGFEVRTYRLCRRVLMFHHFDGEVGIGRDCLVTSTEFDYDDAGTYSLLRGARQVRHVRDGAGYRSRSLPPLEFGYSEAAIDETVHDVADLLSGVDGDRQLADLDGDGLPGVLTAGAGAWWYQRNLSQLTGAAAFAPAEPVGAIPAGRRPDRLLDLAGDGSLDMVSFDGPLPGFTERTEDGWSPLRPFTGLPALDWQDPRLRFVDLTGDGHADVLITDDGVLRWHCSLGEDGFGPQRTSAVDGPRIVHADRAETVVLADLTGDGLADLVRIRHAEVAYWPNLGHGRFGELVAMDDPPLLDHPELFDARRVQLADIDGSGTADLIYQGGRGVVVHLNRSGNSWGAARRLTAVPAADGAATVSVTDLLGSGTACLVWSSPLPGLHGGAPTAVRYLDLMGGRKPHLLTSARNNRGGRTEIDYTPSTRFMLRDRAAGEPWTTRLPFPVHCVSRVVVTDRWRGTRFATDYRYHHGHFDGAEREFRGFGRVEQIDAETFGEFAEANSASPYVTDDHTLYQSPVKTITWFHTGAESTAVTVERERFDGGVAELVSAGPVLGDDLAAIDIAQAVRAAKGSMLREERYELDVDELAAGREVPVRLFSVTAHRDRVRCLRPTGAGRHGVFLTLPVESVTHHYELDLRAGAAPDPRISHRLTLRTDEYGHPLQEVAVGYRRIGRFADDALSAPTVAAIRAMQDETRLSYTETRYTVDLPASDDEHRLRVPCESLGYDLAGVPVPAPGELYTVDDLLGLRLSDVHQAAGDPVPELPFHVLPHGRTPQRRLLGHGRTLFVDDAAPALDRPAPLRTPSRLGLVFESHRLAFTTELLTAVLGDRVTPAVAAVLADPAQSGYLVDGGRYWSRSGTVGYAADPFGTFLLPHAHTDPFGNRARQTYDARLLFVRTSTDARDNVTEVLRYDHRVLAPVALRDPNGNLAEVAFDLLGLPAVTAVRGKGAEADDLDALTPALLDPTSAEVAAFVAGPDLDEPRARLWLGDATTRHVYHLGETVGPAGALTWENAPPSGCTIRRERHVRDLAPGAVSPLQVAFEYVDGVGEVLVRKAQAPRATPGGPLRWVSTGLGVVNNKGSAVKQHEPFFSPPEVGLRFAEPVPVGLTTLTFHDAVDRVVRIEHPDGTFSRVEFTPWLVRTFDRNDTVTGSDWYRGRTAPGTPDADARAARLAAEHADTPAVTVLDSLGRQVVAVAHNRFRDEAGTLVDERQATLTRYDVTGNPLWTRDARGNLVTQLIQPAKPVRIADEADPSVAELVPAGGVPGYDLAGNALAEHCMDTGDRWRLPDATGGALFVWDIYRTGDVVEERLWRSRFDALRRPLIQQLTVAGAAPVTTVRHEYVDTADHDPTAAASNLLGRLRARYDQAGVVRTGSVDLAGNVVEQRRQLVADHRAVLTDWSGAPALDPAEYTHVTRYDALGRVLRGYDWHRGIGSRVAVHEPSYDAAGLLARTDLVLRATKTATGHTEGPEARRRSVIASISYDALGRRQRVEHGNGTTTTYEVDRATRRVRRLRTAPTGGGPALQHVEYTYDAIGNLVEVLDDAYAPVFFANQLIEPRCRYTFDSLYRLTSATGRENGAATGAPSGQEPPSARVTFPVSDPMALRNYTQTYRYDAVGNLAQVRHGAGPTGGWTRTLTYRPDANRLATTAVGADPAVVHRHDSHGNLLNLANTVPGADLVWDHFDMLASFDRGGGGVVHYGYDADRQRVVKVAEDLAGTVTWRRISLGGMEIYRRYGPGGTVVEEVESIQVSDGERRVLVVDDVLVADSPQAVLGPLFRFQYDNHLGSAALELDHTAAVVSYEEWHPYGSTAYLAMSKEISATAKRFRFTGRERDEESGLSLHGLRYYVPWLGRWASADPAGLAGGINRYAYALDNPTQLKDDAGTWPKIIDTLRKDPVGTLSQAAQTYGKVLVSYSEARIQQLNEKGTALTPIGLIKQGIGLAEKVKDEATDIKKAYTDGGGGAKGAALATSRAMAGRTLGHTADAMVKAHKAGASPLQVLDKGLDKLADETKEANPLYHLGVGLVGAPVAAAQAIDKGDTSAAGKNLAEGQAGLEEAAQAIVPLAAEAGLLAKAAPPVRGAMSGQPPGTLPPAALPGVGTITEVANETAAAFRDMRIPVRNQGYFDFTTRQQVPGFNPATQEIGNNMQPGGSKPGGVGVDAGILRPALTWPEWNNATIRTRVRAVLQHEWWEFKGMDHQGSVQAGNFGSAKYLRNLGTDAKNLLKSMPTHNPF